MGRLLTEREIRQLQNFSPDIITYNANISTFNRMPKQEVCLIGIENMFHWGDSRSKFFFCDKKLFEQISLKLNAIFPESLQLEDNQYFCFKRNSNMSIFCNETDFCIKKMSYIGKETLRYYGRQADADEYYRKSKMGHCELGSFFDFCWWQELQELHRQKDFFLALMDITSHTRDRILHIPDKKKKEAEEEIALLSNQIETLESRLPGFEAEKKALALKVE